MKRSSVAAATLATEESKRKDIAMKKLAVILGIVMVATIPALPAYAMGPGMMGGMMGRGYGMGPGIMHGGRGMSPEGVHRGWGMGPQYRPQYGPQYDPGYQGPQYQQPQKPMEEKDAKELLENYLESTRNPNLKLGKIEDKGEGFEADILTKDGSLVDKILVDKRTGWMGSVY